MRTLDRGVSRAKSGPDVEGGCAAAADDDVVCVGVMFASADYVTAGTGTCTVLFSLLVLYVFSPYYNRGRTWHAFV